MLGELPAGTVQPLDADGWIRCDLLDCEKWRRVPASYAARCKHLPLVLQQRVGKNVGYIAAGARGFKNFELFVKRRNGSGEPYVVWKGWCPRCQVEVFIDRRRPIGCPVDKRTTQTFLDQHGEHAPEFASMTADSLPFNVPEADRLDYKAQAARADQNVGEASNQDELCDSAASDSDSAWSPPTPPTQPSETQTVVAAQATAHNPCNNNSCREANSSHISLTAATSSAYIPNGHSPASSEESSVPDARQKRITDFFTVVRIASAPAGPAEMHHHRSKASAAQHIKAAQVMTDRHVPDVHNPAAPASPGIVVPDNSTLAEALMPAPKGLGKGLPARHIAGAQDSAPRQTPSTALNPAPTAAAKSPSHNAVNSRVTADSNRAKATATQDIAPASETHDLVGTTDIDLGCAEQLDNVDITDYCSESDGATAVCEAAAAKVPTTGLTASIMPPAPFHNQTNPLGQPIALLPSSVASTSRTAAPDAPSLLNTAAAQAPLQPAPAGAQSQAATTANITASAPVAMTFMPAGQLSAQFSPSAKIGKAAAKASLSDTSCQPEAISPKKAVQASKEVQSLGVFAWDRRNTEHPPNLGKFEPRQAKRKPKEPLRYVEEPDQEQHAKKKKKAMSNGKRQKLEHHHSVKCDANQTVNRQPHSTTKEQHVLWHSQSGLGVSSISATAGSNTQPSGALSARLQSATAQKCTESSAAAGGAAHAVPSITAVVRTLPTKQATPQRQSNTATHEASLHKQSMHSNQQSCQEADSSPSDTNAVHCQSHECRLLDRAQSGHDAAVRGLHSALPSHLQPSSFAAGNVQDGSAVAHTADLWTPPADHSVYDDQDCCFGSCCLDSNETKTASGLPAALLPQRLMDSKLKGRLLWGATYPVFENRLGMDGDYQKCLAFQRRQFAGESQIVLPGTGDMLQAVAYSSASQQQTSKAKPWVRCEGLSTSGQFTLWHEPPSRCRPQKKIVSSMIFHLRETPTYSNTVQLPQGRSAETQQTHAVVEIMFVATELQQRKKKFFVQLLRLFMREYLLQHYHRAELLVMATPRTAPEWSTDRLAQQLGTQAFARITDHDPLVLGRVKCTDCHWLHLTVDQSLVAGNFD